MTVVNSPVTVLIVDDSIMIRKLLAKLLSGREEIQVIGEAVDPYDAREKIKQMDPDIITLDIEMPKMDGITFVEKIMKLRPMPVVIISSLVAKHADVALRALEMGAVDVISKPVCHDSEQLKEYADDLVKRLVLAAKAKQKIIAKAKAISSKPAATQSPVKSASAPSEAIPEQFKAGDKIIAIGASTGGTVAIANVLQHLPEQSPPVVIAQHIPEAFSEQFAERVNQLARIQVKEAKDGEPLLPGHAYIAPGNRHLTVVGKAGRYFCRLDDGERVNRHKPSVEVLFESVAQHIKGKAVGVMLTGMGKDGAWGMKAMHEAGAVNIAQDEESSVVWGMPGEAVRIGAVDYQLPLNQIAGKLLELCSEK